MSFKRFDPEDLVVSSDKVVLPAWTGNTSIMTSYYTSSFQVGSSSGIYYYDIYNALPGTSSLSEVQFSIAYGHKHGSGSAPYNTAVIGKSPSSTVYGQYRALLLGDEETDFLFGSGSVTSSLGIHVISVARSRFKEKLKPESFQLSIGSSTYRVKNATGSVSVYSDAGRVFEIETTDGLVDGIGKMYPDVGVVVLNSTKLQSRGDLTVSSATTTNGLNLRAFYNTLVAGAGGGFSLQSEETISSNYVFVRARSMDFNHTMNPSLLTAEGDIRYTDLIDNPRTYITTVGLYNDSNDLLAVAKLSSPLQKDFTKETLLRVKLDY